MDRQYRRLPLCLIMLSLFLLVLLQARESSALSDDILTQRIEEQATSMSELEGAQVRVSVEDGLVVLSGTVPLYTQKLLYRKIAWQTLGVAEVEDEIRVLPPFPVEDVAIEAAIQDILNTTPHLQGLEITIRVEGGAVTLEGTFQHPRNVVFLKHKVAALEGVVAIQIHAQFNV